jgi:hypothetical protein
MTAARNSPANPCPFQSAFCVDDNFQNETGKTITTITTQAITTPEPGAGLLVLFSALAFALFKLVRRAV